MNAVQKEVRSVAEGLIASGTDRGLQVVAYVGQELVVDVAAGTADPATGRAVRPDTLFYNWSIGKAATATLVHRLVEAGAFDYDTRVAQLWPAFARHGKQDVTVAQVLNHSAGVPGLPAGVTIDDACSWDTMVAAMEDARPWWEPGTQVGYHAYTFGYLCGEIVRRSTGRELGDVLADLTAELGFPGEIRYGMAPADAAGLAVLEDAPSEFDFSSMPDDLPMFKAAPMSVIPTAELGSDPRVVGADIPAGAKVTARALARLYAGWLGEVEGTRIVSAATAATATAESSSGPDQVYGGDESRWALGFVMGLPWDEAGSPRVFGMAGAGGSWAGADPDRGIAIAVTRSVMSMDFESVRALVEPVLAAVDRA